MAISGIYKIESKIKPQRIYIGSAIDIYDRWSCHKSNLKCKKHINTKLQNHYNKYGESDLSFSIILSCDKEDLIKHEQYFIDAYNPWFNICQNANSRLGVKVTDGTRKKMSSSQKGKHYYWKDKKLTKEHKDKIGNAGRGKQRSAEFKLQMSISAKKHPSNHLGKKHSEETKLKMSIAKKNRIISDESKRRMSEAQKRLLENEEYRRELIRRLNYNKPKVA